MRTGVREYRSTDFATVEQLGRAFHKESPEFRGFRYDIERLAMLSDLIETSEDMIGLVAERGGQICGFFLGGVTPFFFGPDQYAYDLALFVTPDKRGSWAAIRLVAYATEWAKARGAKQLRFGSATGISPEVTARFFVSLGFRDAGRLYAFDL